MVSRWEWVVGLLTRRLWFKAALYGIGAIATALVAIFASPFVPENAADLIGADAVEGILKILASSMLAVATFSLGTMVAAFAAASSAATPRASKILVEDPISQNVLSTFIGAFIFSLVGLIALSTGIYGPGGRFVLFAVTILVIAAVLATFFRWIDYLSNLGRLSETLEKVEQASARSLRSRAEHPHLCGSPLGEVPLMAIAHQGEAVGYVQHLDVEALQKAAEEAGGQVWVGRLPGNWTDPTYTLFWTSWRPDDEKMKTMREAFPVGSTRSFDQDPRFGVIVLSEIASRALSPGVNDPGTAIDVIGRIVRVLSEWSRLPASGDAPLYPRVFVPEITARDLFDDAFGPIARDGAGTFEVGVRLQKALASLSAMSPGRFGEPARLHSKQALELSGTALELDEQKASLRDLAVSERAAKEMPQ